MIVPTVAQTPIVGYSWIVLSAVGTGFLSFGLWVHHMFTTGLPMISLGFFSAASEAVVIPTGVQLFCFLATLMVGQVKRSLPMLFIAGGLAIFTAGGLTGVMLALAPFDWQVHDTYFVVAHLHYVIFGGTVLPIMAGIYYFYPFFAKKLMSERLGRWAFWLIFVGFNVAFAPMHLTGLLGMPRRVFTYPGDIGWDTLNLISTCGAFVIAAGFAVFAWDLIRPKGDDERTPRSPWNAGTLEWSHDVPEDPGWGTRSIPYVTSRYPLWDDPKIVERIDAGRYYLPDAEEGLRETLVTTVLDAKPVQCQRVPGPTWITHSRRSRRAAPSSFRPSRCTRPPSSAPASPSPLSYGGCGTARRVGPRRTRRTSASASSCRPMLRGRPRSAGGRCGSRCSPTPPPLRA